MSKKSTNFAGKIDTDIIQTPIYIVGPCSAESREQVLETAKACAAISRLHPDIRFIFRAGVWKPRTSPYSFQGVGTPALAWLQEVKTTYGMLVATEVATADHVSAALEAGIDYLWIGARTSANPIAVQELARQIHHSLQGILIKNPVNADAALWLGNIARLEATGVPVIAVHRGCNHQPCWSMAHAVRTARPEIPMLLDPSHMSGEAEKVPALLNKIAELALDGAMVEVHCHPEAALSDSRQQLRPDQLSFPTPLSSPDTELNWLRAEIDELDERLWDTIADRMDVSKRIGAWKKAQGVAPLQPERYQQIIDRLRTKNEQLKDQRLSEDFIFQLWELIHAESLRMQE